MDINAMGLKNAMFLKKELERIKIVKEEEVSEINDAIENFNKLVSFLSENGNHVEEKEEIEEQPTYGIKTKKGHVWITRKDGSRYLRKKRRFFRKPKSLKKPGKSSKGK